MKAHQNTGTTLSDLTLDSLEGSASLSGKGKSVKAATMQKLNTQQKSGQGKASAPQGMNKFPATKGPGLQSYPGHSITFSPPSNDALHVYGDEGTPVTFSRNNSLSSLGGEDDGRGTASGLSASPHKDRNRSNDRDESDSSSSIPRERHVVGQSSEDSSVAGDKVDRPIKFVVEDTPVCFSRNSSLSSITSLDKLEHTEVSASNNSSDAKSSFLKSDVKPSESNGSLSDELADCDPTPSEQALLEQCINSVMPKARHSRGEDRTKRHSRSKFLMHKPGAKGGNMSMNDGLMKSASLEITSEIFNGYHSSSENDHGSQGSLSQGHSSCENLMTRSCSDTRELDLDFQTTPSSRQSRYCSWRRQRHHSQDDGKSVRAHFRSHSQENENYLMKAQKDMNNKLAKAINHTGQQFYQGSLESFESVVHDRQVKGPDDHGQVKTTHHREVSDFAAKVREISNDSMGGLLALRDDVDLDAAIFSEHNVVEVTADEENVNQTLKDEDYDASDAANTTVKADEEEAEEERNGEVHFFIEDEEDPDYDEVYDGNISLEEEERLLAENVHLIMSEIQTTKMSGSTVDEDLFIENETISLVSNDYASDTNSEASVTWSVTSDKTSDFSSSTLAEVKSQGSSQSKGGPKIIKPGLASAPVLKVTADEVVDEGKGVRGRRKPLYPGKSAIAKVKPSTTTSVSQGVKGVLPQKNINLALLKKTPPKQMVVAQVSPRTKQQGQNPQINNSNLKKEALKKAVSPRSRSAGPATGKSSTNIKQTSPRTANSPAGRSSSTKAVVAKTSSSPPSGAPSKTNNVPKPSTPPKSLGKDKNTYGSSPNVLNKTLSSDNKENKEKTETSYGFNNDVEHRMSNDSAPDSWSKALDSYNFIVDTSAQEGIDYKQMQRNSKDAQGAMKRALKMPNKSPSSIPTITKPSSSSNTVQTQSKLPTLCQGNKTSTSVSPSSHVVKTSANTTRSASSNTIVQSAVVEKKSAVTKNTSSPANVGTVKGFSRSLSSDAKVSNVSKSNDSLKAPHRPLTPVNSGNSRRSSHSSTSGIPTRTSDGSNTSLNADSNKRTPPGVMGKKQVTSKIATLWKRDSSLERSPSRDSPSSSASSLSKLPVSTSPGSAKPSSLPPSGFKTKAATLPASSSLTASKSSTEGICKSATYEKISSEIRGVPSPKRNQSQLKNVSDISKGYKQKEGSYESPESGVRRGEVFELYDDHDDDEDDFDDRNKSQGISDTNESLESHVFEDSLLSHHDSLRTESADSLDQSCDSGTHIDSSTFRKKKRDPSISDLELPNADETCKSICSFNDSVGFNYSNNNSVLFKNKSSLIDSSIISDMSLSGTPLSKHDKKSKNGDEKTGKTKSKVAQGLKRLFGSGRNKESKKNNEMSKSKSADKDLNKSKKSGSKDKKNSKDKKEYDFFSANIKIEPSTMTDVEDRLVCHQGTTTAMTPKSGQLRTEHKVSPSAIVAPFNYNPPVSVNSNGNASLLVADLLSAIASPTGQQCLEDHENKDGDSLGSNPDKHMTKTEMLLARRRQRVTSTSKDESKSDGDILAACMVTTV